MDVSKEEALAELKKRGYTVSSGSVLEEKGTSFEEFKKATESLLKGSAAGVVGIVGGWGNLYDALNKSEDPNAFSSAGIMKGIKDLGGPDLQQIQGYRGAYEFGQAAAPAALMTAAGAPGLFSRTPLGVTGEALTAGATGTVANTVSPDSPLAQFALQSTPYLAKGALTSAQAIHNRPQGQLPANAQDLLQVGRLTPGEMTGNRPQLAREASTEMNPKILNQGEVFRQAQAQDVSRFLDNVFTQATSKAVDPQAAATGAYNAFSNYGKSLSTKLRNDARVDFGAAKGSGGMVSTEPVVSVIKQALADIPPETPALQGLKSSLENVLKEYVTPATEAKITPSTILGPTGQPASVNVTPATPEQLSKISIDRLQKNLSAWGEAAYSGKADFGKGNIFEGVAPGQVKGIALKVLQGFRSSLDQAVESGVAGADKLVKARDSFKANLQKIEEYSNYPLTKYFDMPTATSKTPEEIINRLSSAAPSERLFLAQVLENSPDGSKILDSVKRRQLSTVLEKSQKMASGAAEGAPEYNLSTMLKELNNKKGDFNYLMPNKVDQANAALAIQWLQKQAKTAKEIEKQTQGNAYAASKSVGGTTQQSMAIREIAGFADWILSNPRATADVIFNPDTVKKMAEAQRRGNLFKASEIAKDLSAVAAKFSGRVGPMLDTSQPVDTEQSLQQKPVDVQTLGISKEQALKELQARNINIGQ